MKYAKPFASIVIIVIVTTSISLNAQTANPNVFSLIREAADSKVTQFSPVCEHTCINLVSLPCSILR
jgi:hypothetical protein